MWDLETCLHGVGWLTSAPGKKVENFPAPEGLQPGHGVKSPGPTWTFFQSCLCNIVDGVCRKWLFGHTPSPGPKTRSVQHGLL